MDKDLLIQLGIKKRNGDIKDSWNEIGNKFNITGEQARDIVRKYIYKTIESNGDKLRILHISDQHHPYNLPKEVFHNYVNKVDVLVFGGDEQDCQSLSKFRKKYRSPFVEEMIGTRQMIIDTIEYIKPKKVVLNYGNHNVRLINYFSDSIHEDLLQLMPETNLDFIIDIGFWQHNHKDKSKTFYEPLKKVFEGKVEIEYTGNWWTRIGNTIFAHPKAFKQGILGTSEKAYLYFLQLGEQDINSLVVAHTHKQAFTRYGKCLFYESGSLCEEQEYATSGGLSQPQSQGFVYLIQDKSGNVIYDESKLVLI